MALGIDFSTQKPPPALFQSRIQKAQQLRTDATWTLADAYVFSQDNPDYVDYFENVYDETLVSRNTITKYQATIRTFPYARRKWNLSIDMYYSVTSIRHEDGSPATFIQDELLRKVDARRQRGEIGTRDWLREEVKKLKREPIVEREKVVGKVGSIDEMLRTFHQLPDGYEVEIMIKKPQAYEQSELETETAREAA